MKLQSIQNKLMLAVAGLLIGIGFLLTAFMLNFFSKSLQASAIAHGDRLCQTLALEAANGILGSDSASLRKLHQGFIIDN